MLGRERTPSGNRSQFGGPGDLFRTMDGWVQSQVVQTGMLTWTDYPGLPKPAPLVSGPVEFSGMDTGIHRRPPTLGEHTDQVLGSVGYSASEIAGLRARRIV